jgi:bZIP Maf transcription factor
VSDTSIGAGTSGSSSESEAYSRDEKRARAMNIPMTVDDIINLPMDEFNERLSKYDLTEAQLSLIRDIRRRGKNKVAAQNCRKRKLDQILTLADEVKRVRERKIRLHKEREFLLTEKARIKDRFAQLYRHVFQSLRDADGQPYSPYEYSLQQSADGNILLVPRAATHNSAPIDPQPSTVRPILDASGSGMSNAGVNSNANMNVSGSATGEHHGARRKNPDHKNEP